MRETLARLPDLPLGIMAQPGNTVHLQANHYPKWAADNACFSQGDKFDLSRYLRWLDGLKHRETLAFATAPDVVGDAAATIARSLPVLPQIRALGFPAAFVLQNGQENLPMPWDELDAVFTGGDTAWKLSEHAYALVAEAKRRGKWAHMGRVNSYSRLVAARNAGYDSADGTFIKFGPDVNLDKVIEWLRSLRRQPALTGMF